ncbi:MAG: F0F1 ATP synthase subunit epsilon [Pseudomonadota bacterium]
MADKLHFSLVSPERELMSREVDQVVVPGTDGRFGVLANHAPFMSTLTAGLLSVMDGGKEEKVFVRGGFADVTPAGLTVLAEEATPVSELVGDAFGARYAKAEDTLKAAETDEERLEAQNALTALQAVRDA